MLESAWEAALLKKKLTALGARTCPLSADVAVAVNFCNWHSSRCCGVMLLENRRIFF